MFSLTNLKPILYELAQLTNMYDFAIINVGCRTT